VNRKERRAAMKQQINKHRTMMNRISHDRRVEELLKNGITMEDLRNEYLRGHEDGMKETGVNVVKACYAGICIALHDEFGFGPERCFRALKAVDEKTVWALNNYELTDEVLDKTGITLDFDEAFERIGQKRMPGKGGGNGGTV